MEFRRLLDIPHEEFYDCYRNDNYRGKIIGRGSFRYFVSDERLISTYEMLKIAQYMQMLEEAAQYEK